MGDTGNLLANRPRAVIRQLVDQLKTAFIMALLTLWLATLKSAPGKREAWWVFMILSIVVMVIWLVWWWKKARRAPKWWLPFVMLVVIEGLIWFDYWISGISSNVIGLEVIGYFLLLWAVLLLLALVLSMFRPVRNGNMGEVISKVARWGDNANGPLSVALLASSVILAWSRLWSAGYSGWWMAALLYLGVAMLYIVAAAPLFSRSEGDS
jgi:hypothetical protein